MSSIDDLVLKILETAPGADEESRRLISERAANVLRPAGALARLDEVCAWLASWQRTTRPAVSKPAVVVFLADHGVTAASASADPAEGQWPALRARRVRLA